MNVTALDFYIKCGSTLHKRGVLYTWSYTIFDRTLLGPTGLEPLTITSDGVLVKYTTPTKSDDFYSYRIYYSQGDTVDFNSKYKDDK